jgi:hypothetical protein
MRNISALGAAFLVLLLAALGCKQLAKIGEVNLFEGDAAVKAAAAIKSKVGADKVKVIRGEIRKDSMKITIQAPDNPKNLDEYSYDKSGAKGPKPVQAASFGNLEMTADRYFLTDLSDINFAAVPDTVKAAIERSGLDKGEVDLISMENARAEMVNPAIKAEKKRKADELQKQIDEKSKECFRTFSKKACDELQALNKQHFNSSDEKPQFDMAWRIFVQGPRGRKDFYADKQGKIIDNPY